MNTRKLWAGVGMAAIVALGLWLSAIAQAQVRKQGGDDQLLVKAARECAVAERWMGRALPIYHGHRVKAMHLTRIAIREIRLALRFDRNRERNPQSLESQLREIGNPTEQGGNFSDAQVRRSNQIMVKAGEILTQAKGDLTSAPKDYGGHKANAIKLVDMAIAEIKLGLDGVGRQRP